MEIETLLKPLEQMTNVDKARMLYILLPGQIPYILKCMKGMSKMVTERQDKIRETWDNPMLSFDFWLKLSEQVGEAAVLVERDLLVYRDNLTPIKHEFADTLFEGYLAMFANHCLFIYLKDEKASEDYKNLHTFLYTTL